MTDKKLIATTVSSREKGMKRRESLSAAKKVQDDILDTLMKVKQKPPRQQAAMTK